MAKQHFRLVTSDVFPDLPFFEHLQRGAAFFRRNQPERAIEEWAAARRLNCSEPVHLKRVEGKIACGIRLDQTPLLHFLYAVEVSGASGVGAFRTGRQSITLVFFKGHPTATGISPNPDQFKKLLRREGMRSEEDFHRIVETAKRMGRDVGVYLVEKKHLSADTLKAIRVRLLVRRFAEMLSKTGGTFVFIEKPGVSKPQVEIPFIELAEMTAKSALDFTAFQKRIPDFKTIFRHSPYLGENRKRVIDNLGINIQYLFSLIDGARNVEQLKRFSGADETTILKNLYELNIRGLIRRTREVMEYEDKEFVEINKSIGVLFDVYKLITNDLFRELGQRGREAIEDARQILHPDHQKVFDDMTLTAPEELKAEEIIRNLARNFPQTDQRLVFIDAFNELYLNILDELIKFLGIGLTGKTVKEIKHKISDIERFASETAMKKRLLKVLSRLSEKS